MTLFYKVNRSGKAKVLSPEERTLIQDNLPQKYRLVADLLYWSAGRISEVLAIRVRNLVPETGMVILERGTTKMKKSREVYLPPKLMNSLVLRARRLRPQPNDFLFFNPSPTQSRNGIIVPLCRLLSSIRNCGRSVNGTVCWECPLTPIGGHN